MWCLLILLVLTSTSRDTSVGAAKIVWNATIYTVNVDQPSAEAIAIGDDGTILAVGTNTEILSLAGNDDDLMDMNGLFILPGFQDAHLHAVEAGINRAACYFDPEPLLEDLPFYFDDCPNGGLFGDQGWMVGSGVDVSYLQTELFEFGERSPIEILDDQYPSTPVLILDNLGHGAVANTAAMQAVGYDRIEGNPPGGIIVRGKSGALTGIVMENAQQRLRDAAFPPTEANMQTAYESLLDALGTLAANGITSVSDAGGFWRQAQTESWARAEQEGLMTVRASNALYVYPDQSMNDQLPELISRYSNDESKLVRFNQAKIYVDGILSLGTGALYEPYEPFMELETDQELGLEYFDSAQNLNTISSVLSDNGFQLHFHVTGDRGATLGLDAIQVSNNSSGPHRLTHCYMVDERDRDRFAQLNAIADFQLAPSSVSQENLDFLRDALGSTRSSQILPALEVYNLGATVVLSSDWDADVLSPISKIQTALTRPDGRSFPNVETVIPLLTLNPAQLLGTNTGSLEVGKLGDLVAIDKNILLVPTDEIDTASVMLTMMNGNVVFDPTGIAGPLIGTPAPAPTASAAVSRSFSITVVLLLALGQTTFSFGLLF